MIITPKFVFIHMPKIGGTFVQSSFNEIYGSQFYRPLTESPISEFLKRIKFWEKPVAYQLIKHAPCNQIPKQFQTRPILSCIRNPLEWYISNYKYGWWLSHPEDYPNLKNDPAWPDLSFSHYLTLSGSSWIHAMYPECQLEIGRLSALFIQYYCKDPNWVVSANSQSELFERVKQDMYSVHFLNTKNLNVELYAYLQKKDYPLSKIEFIKNAPALSPRGNRKSSDSIDDFFDSKLKESIYQKDQVLFNLFPDL